MSILRAAPSTAQVNVGLLVLRVILGFVFIMHGGQKLFVYGVDGVAGGFAQSGIPLSGVVAPLVTAVELLGGVALVLGVLTRLAALGIIATMFGAIMFVHAAAGFFAPTGFEFPLALVGMAATLAITGAGAYSVDALIGRRTVEARAGAAAAHAGAARRAA